MDYGATVILNDIGYESLDVLAGGETAGILCRLARRATHLPMQYVRKKPKGFGRDARIEGNMIVGQRTLLIEDLMTDGGTKVNFVEALRAAGAVVGHTFVIFYYDIFTDTKVRLSEAEVSLHYLATWWDVLDEIKLNDRFGKEMIATVEGFLTNPREWSAKHGGI